MREAGSRLFHREGPTTVKDLDLIIVVPAQGTRRYQYSRYSPSLGVAVHLISKPTDR